MSEPDIQPDQGLSVREIETITGLARSELDALPVGVIRVDLEGAILEYNAVESRLSGLPPAEALGRNFFTEVAPCTNVREFAGRFRAGVEQGRLYEAFPYVFRFKRREVTVVVTLYRAPDEADAWIFVDVSG